jgi:hypothetical protein
MKVRIDFDMTEHAKANRQSTEFIAALRLLADRMEQEMQPLIRCDGWNLYDRGNQRCGKLRVEW